MATVPLVSENPIAQEHYATQLGLIEALVGAGSDAGSALATLSREFQAASIALSVDYYAALRNAANVAGAYSQPVMEPWSTEQITAYFDSGPEAQAIDMAQRLTLDAGINQVFTSMSRDPVRPRWARVTRPGACSFCLMLASRGAVYRSEDTADFRAHGKFNGRGGVCKCGVEVSFTQYEPPAHIREAQRLYREATADLPRGADRANAFRRALYAERQTSR